MTYTNDTLIIKLCLTHLQCKRNYSVHVIILIFAKADHRRLPFLHQLPVSYIQRTVRRFLHCSSGSKAHRPFPLGTILTGNYCLRQVIAVLILTKIKPLVFNNARPCGLPVRTVHSSVSLEIRLIKNLIFKANRMVFKITEGESKGCPGTKN